MLHALSALVLAAESEPSKTPFYIVGGLLAVWAVVLAAIGMSQAGFPATASAKRGVMGISTLLMAGAMVTAVVTA